MTIPKPLGAPKTISGLYQHYTGDKVTPEEFVREVLRSDYAPRTWAITCLLRGYTYTQIAGAGEVTPRAINAQVKRAMVRAWKVVNNKPRYYLKGRKKNVDKVC